MEAVDILIFGAHPDDAEIGMGATIVKHARAGRRIAVCDLTEAEMSSNGTVETRRQEAAAAAQILGLAARSNLLLPDRGLFHSKEQLEAIVAEIRRYRPRLVFAPHWIDRHPDHTATSRLVEEAVFNAKLRNYLPSLPAITVEQLYFYFINDVQHADLIVDVTEDYEMKRQALRAYRTQFTPAAKDDSFVATPLNQGYLERVELRDQLLGGPQGIKYAEGFVTKQPFLIPAF